MDITVENVCQFIIDHGGKVKNTTLVSYFKKVLNDPATRNDARQKFKECVNTVAVVKTENGEKFVQLKKKYRPSSTSGTTASDDTSNVTLSPSQDGSQEQTKINESQESHDASYASTDASPYSGATNVSRLSESKVIEKTSPKKQKKEKKSPKRSPSPVKREASRKTVDDSHQARESFQPTVEPVNTRNDEETHFRYETDKRSSTTQGKDERMSKYTSDALEKNANGTTNKSDSHSRKLADSAAFVVPASAPLRKKKKENVPPSPVAEQKWTTTSVDRVKSSLMNMTSDNRMSRMRPTSIVQGSHAGSVERAKQNFQTKPKVYDDSASLAPSEKSLDSKGEEGDDEYYRSVALDMNEKSWIIRVAQANLVEMRILLDLDSGLADKRDFIMSAVHWAAKKGNVQMLEMMLDQKVDINSKTGYTPLHLAAMGGHIEIISRLLDSGAEANIRDYSGHKPVHYLKSAGTVQINPFGNDINQQGLIKDPAVANIRHRNFGTGKSSKISKGKKSKKGKGDERPTISVMTIDYVAAEGN